METRHFGFCRMWAFTVGVGQLNKHVEDIALALKDLSVYVRVYYSGLFLGCSFKKKDLCRLKINKTICCHNTGVFRGA